MGVATTYFSTMSAQPMEIEYNKGFGPLEKILARVRRDGDFQVRGTRELPMPRIEVDGIGILSFPVPESQAVAMIGCATQAPYGRGTETLVDPNVRRVWQLSPDRARIGGQSWPNHFAAILEQVSTGLGCEGWKITAELYKILIYDEGGFFTSHRDTEKVGGMFGTLIVVLPSAHQGGELIIRHAGREVTVDMAHLENSEIGFVAFYADCEHEVRPVTAGHRICLVYNLIQSAGPSVKGSGPLAIPDETKTIQTTAKLLGSAFSSPIAPVKIAWLLEHHYSPDGLTFAALKSADRARAKVLIQAAEIAGCVAHLGIVHLEQSGSAESNYDSSYRGRRRYHEEVDEDEPPAPINGNFEIVDIYNSEQFIDQWRDSQDQPVSFGPTPLKPGELLPDGALDGVPPDKQRLTEATGNEGASFERSYHRAAVVVWPAASYSRVLLQAGAIAALPLLQAQLIPADGTNQTIEALEAAANLAQQMVESWPPPFSLRIFQRGPVDQDTARTMMLGLLIRLGDVGLIQTFVERVVITEFDGLEIPKLIEASNLIGPENASTLWVQLMTEHAALHPEMCIRLLKAIAASLGSNATPAWTKAFRLTSIALTTGLTQQKPKPADRWNQPQSKSAFDAPGLATLIKVLENGDVADLARQMIEKMLKKSEQFDPLGVLAPALSLLSKPSRQHKKRFTTFAPLWTGTVGFLLQRSEQPPAAPQNWQQTAKLQCPCAGCRELQVFILDPEASVHRFRVRQELRSHLSAQISFYGLEMDSETDRIGRPQTLVCTKNRREYERRCVEYRNDISALKMLADLMDTNAPETATELERITAASDLAKKWSPA